MTVRNDGSPRLFGPDVWVPLALLAAIAWRSFIILSGDLSTVTLRSSDDAYYYFQVALHITQGQGSTFDGIHPTNGYHPLWMLLILPIYEWAGRDPALALRLTFVLATVLAGGVLWTAYRVFRSLAGWFAALVGVVLFLQPFCWYPLVNGLETGLLILCLMLTLAWVTRHDALGPRRSHTLDFIFGLLLGLSFLARLDSIFIVPAVIVVMGVQVARRRGAARQDWLELAGRWVFIGAGFLLLALPYVIWNLASFGHIVPISGAIKGTFPIPSPSFDRLTRFPSVYGMGLALGATFFLGVLRFFPPRWRDGAGDGQRDALTAAMPFLVALWLGNLLHLAYSLLFVSWGGNWWHFASYLPATLTLAVIVYRSMEIRVRRTGLFRVAVMVLLVATFLASSAAEARRRGETRESWQAAAAWTQNHLAKDAVIAMTDCGFFGYFCGRPTMNLDGIINGYAYQTALAENYLSGFLKGAGVTHIGGHAVHYTDGRYIIWLPARLDRKPGGAIVATPDAEVYASPPFPAAPGRDEGVVHFAIWDITKVRVFDDAVALQRELDATR